MTSQMTSAKDVQTDLLSTMRQDHNLIHSPIQSGRIYGLPFVRGYLHVGFEGLNFED